MTVKFIFKNDRIGSADGKILINLAINTISPDATVTLYWGVNGQSGISPLPEYTPIARIKAEHNYNELVIDKQLRIPSGAEYLLAVLDDGITLERASFKLPASKLTKEKAKPLYTVGFASDFHIGGWGSESYPKEGLLKARDEFNLLVDFLVTEGDLVQWHGCFSGEEFKKYNYDSKSKQWGDNGERNPEYIEIGRSQWEMLDEYMSGFSIPVYHCQGNHDIIDEDHWSPVCGNKDYFGNFLTKWIKESEQNGKYESKIERDEGVHYYSTTVRGHKFVFTEAPHPYSPHHTIGKDELDWLDRTLFDGEESGKPIFVMGHSPIDERLNKKTAYAKFTDLDELKKVLSKHPTVIYVSGHSHFTLDTPLRNTIDGRQEEPSHIHNGGMTTTIDPPPMTQYDVTHGTIAEVYENGILIKGRNHSSGKWISMGETELTFKKPCLSGRIGIEANANILTAHAENTDGIAFEWYVDGEFASDKNTFPIPKGEYGYIALRAKDSEGGFCSIIYNM